MGCMRAIGDMTPPTVLLFYFFILGFAGNTF